MLSQHWIGPVLQLPADVVVVVPGAVEVTVTVTVDGEVVAHGVATARRAKKSTERTVV